MNEPHPYRWTVLIVGAFGAAAFTMYRMGMSSLAPTIRDEFGLTLGQVGMVFTATAVGVALGLLPWGMLTDRIGERPVLAVGLTLFSAVLAGVSFTSTFPALLVGFTLCGITGASATGASGRAIMGWFSRSERGLALGIRQMALPVGGAIGSVALPLIAGAGGLQAALLSLSGLALTAALACALWMRDSPATAGASTDLARPHGDARQWRLGFVGALLSVSQSATLGFTVLYLHDERDLSVGAAAACLSVIQLSAAITRITAGRISDRRGLRLPLLRVLAVTISSLFAATALLSAFGGLLVVPVLVAAGVCALSWNGLAFTAAAEIAGLTRAGTAMSLQNTITTLTAIVAPVTFGLLADATSYSIGYAVVALGPAISFVVMGSLLEDEARRARDHDAALEQHAAEAAA